MSDMTDREMLALAAKAAGIDGYHATRGDGTVCLYDGRVYFDPLTDDGDALRLAVKLGLSIEFWEGLVIVADEHEIGEECGNDPDAATRRAITRAAAEIGRNMK